MTSFFSKFCQDNLFFFYFYFSNDLTREFFLFIFVNVLFIFYFVFCLYVLNLISYTRNNFFEDSQVATFLRDIVLRYPGDGEAKTYATNLAFYFYNFLTVAELLIKASFIIAIGFLSFRFPSVDINSNPLLSLRFANFFSKSRFYSFRPRFFKSADSSSGFSSSRVASSGFESPSTTFGYTFETVQTHRVFKFSNKLYGQRIRPDLPDPPIFEGDRYYIWHKLTRDLKGIDDFKSRVWGLLGFGSASGLDAVRRLGPKFGIFRTVTNDVKSPIAPALVYQSGDGVIRPKSLLVRRYGHWGELSYFRPEDLDFEVPRDSGLLTRLFFPGGRSKATVHILPLTPPHEREIELYYFRPRRHVFDNDMWAYQMEDMLRAPFPDDPVVFPLFMSFLDIMPDIERIPENIKVADRPRIVKDFRKRYKGRMEAHERLVSRYPELGTPFVGSDYFKRFYDHGTRFIKSIAEPELYDNQLNETEDLYVLDPSMRRFRSHYRITAGRPFPKEEAVLDAGSFLGLPREAHYVVKAKVKSMDDETEELERFDSIVDPTDFEVNFMKGYSHFAPRSLFDFLSTRALRFLRKNSSFKHRRVRGELPRRCRVGASRELVRLPSFEEEGYRKFLLFKLGGRDLGVYNDRDFPYHPAKYSPVGGSSGFEEDGAEYPFISSRPDVCRAHYDARSLKLAHSRRLLLNKQALLYTGPGASFSHRIARNDSQWFEKGQGTGSFFKRGPDGCEGHKSELEFFGLNWHGFLPKFVKRVWQSALDQSLYLGMNILAGYNALDKVSQFAKPSSEASHREDPSLNYYVFRFRTFYFFRRLLRDLYLRSPLDKVRQCRSNEGRRLMGETEIFTLFLVESVAKNTFNKVLFLLIFLVSHTISNFFYVATELFFRHPAFVLVCGCVLAASFWRVLYPFEVEFKFLRRLRVDVFWFLREVYAKLARPCKYAFDQLSFAQNMFIDGNFKRTAGEPPYDFNYRFQQSVVSMYSAAGFFEKRLNFFLTKIGYKKELYDRTMFKVYYKERRLKKRGGRFLFFRKLPYVVRVSADVRPLKAIALSKFSSVRALASKIGSRAASFAGKFNKFCGKHFGVFKLKASNYVYSVRNWLNR